MYEINSNVTHVTMNLTLFMLTKRLSHISTRPPTRTFLLRISLVITDFVSHRLNRTHKIDLPFVDFVSFV